MITRILVFLLHSIVWALMLLCLLNEWVSPKYFGAYPNFLTLIFPVLTAIYLIFCVYWVFNFRKRAFLFLFSFVLFFNPIRRWVNFSTEKEIGKNAIKIMSYNVNNGKTGFKNFKEYFLKQNADVILLQEASYRPKVKDLALENYQKPLIFPVVSLITKHQVVHSGNLLDESTNGHCFYADIRIKNDTIRFVNFYLEPFSLNKSELMEEFDRSQDKGLSLNELLIRMRKVFIIHSQQVEKINEFTKNSPYPLVLCGDANATPNSYEYFNLVNGLTDAFMEVGSGWGSTFHDWKIPMRIDFVFGSKKIKFLKYNIDKTIMLSDHFPTIVQFEIKK